MRKGPPLREAPSVRDTEKNVKKSITVAPWLTKASVHPLKAQIALEPVDLGEQLE